MNSQTKIYRVRSARVLSASSSVPMELGCVTFQCGCVPQPRSSWKPLLLGFLGRIPHVGMINY